MYNLWTKKQGDSVHRLSTGGGLSVRRAEAAKMGYNYMKKKGK